MNHLSQAFNDQQLSKLTLSKNRSAQSDLKNVYGRLVLIKDEAHLSCTLRFATRDETKNFSLTEATAAIEKWLTEDFRQAELFTVTEQFSLMISKKGKGLLRTRTITNREPVSLEHNQQKQRPLADRPRAYLTSLGIAGQDGQILQNGRRKFRQINKYIELISHLLREQPLAKDARIVDMGSGKGYLTFGLYDYLVNETHLPIKMTGVELRPDLVQTCTTIAQENKFTGLEFLAGDIHQYEPEGGIDMLIALHACDTATDEAIAKGIRAEAQLIIVAPCCHKQVRKAMHPPAGLLPMLQHGILLERQAEMLTDAIRSLLLEAHGYKTKVFEFIGTEHTPKNVMITAIKSEPRPAAQEEIHQLKSQFGIERHHLEDLLLEIEH
ncbi:SAM-dependent methyltransferase [Lewinella sp. LCG006]|uniref:class I SAM-dependent methyltransferase n=1 Tax=Lewinella sp. LCG006 TaxID=3231911 RepID=UPI00345F4A00